MSTALGLGFSLWGRIDTHPLVLLASCYVILGICLVYVPPLPRARRAAFCLVLVWAILALNHADASQAVHRYRLFFGHCTVGVLLYANYFLCDLKSAPPFAATETTWAKAKWAFGLMSNPRGIGTSWEIRNIAPFSRANKAYIPSRGAFLVKRILGFLCLYTLASSYGQARSTLVTLRSDDFAIAKTMFFRRLDEVTTRELLMRFYFPVNTFLPLYLNHGAMHSLVSSVAVALGDSPDRWPPLYGSLREAYSLRRFWSKFWHGLYYKGFVANATCISHELLGIRRNTSVDRWAITFFSFTLSGLVHIVGDKFAGPNCSIGPLVQWYTIQGLAVIFEDVVQQLYRQIWGKSKGSGAHSVVWMVVGYLWTFAVFSWSLPKMQMPNFGCVR